MKVKKAVIPAAGFGTRFLPATKAQPKEMLPVVDRPVIQYQVRELINSGIKEILIITGRNKHSIADHFDSSPELEKMLQEKGKLELLREVQSIANDASIHYIRQKEQKGLGDAIRYAKAFVGNEPFLVLLGDDIVDSKTPAALQLLKSFEIHQNSIVAVENVPKEHIHKYGVIKPKQISENFFEVEDIIEKPNAGQAPSNLAVFGRYLLTPEIFEMLEKTKPGVGGEIQLTDAIKLLLQKQKVCAQILEGTRYDVGRKTDYIRATVELALKRPEMREEVLKILKKALESSV